MQKAEIPLSHEHFDCSECNIRLKSIFCDLHKNDLQKLNDSKKVITVKKGQIIYRENSYPSYLFCINEGKVKITQMGIDGVELILNLVTSGNVLGYRAILCGDKYTTTATAIEDSSLCLLPVELFLSIVKENQNLSFKVIQLFSEELKDAEKKIINLTQRPVVERVAQCLLLLKEIYGYENDKCTIKIVISRNELASIAGTTRETATRMLLELMKKEIIELYEKKIKILKHSELLNIANVID